MVKSLMAELRVRDRLFNLDDDDAIILMDYHHYQTDHRLINIEINFQKYGISGRYCISAELA